MVYVAIIGGSGHVGKTVIEALIAHPSHTVISIGRKAPGTSNPNVPFITTDYRSSKTLSSAFEQYNVDTVISCLFIDNNTTAAAQSIAIEAAHQSPCTKRFIASNWAPSADTTPSQLNPWGSYQIRAQAHLRQTTLIWTEIQTGYFLDYWGIPFLKSNMTPDPIAIDMKNRVAAIPGTGNEPVSFAYTYDVARFIAEKLLPQTSSEEGLDPQWEEATLVLGDRMTWNEFLAIAQEARPGEWRVSYDSDKALAAGKLTELPAHVEAYSSDPPEMSKDELREVYTALGRMMAHGGFNVPMEKATNVRWYPDFEMLTVKKMLAGTWGKNMDVFS